MSFPCPWDVVPVPLVRTGVLASPERDESPYRDSVDQAPPRTLLEQLVRESRRTIDENCAAFGRTAARHREDATLSPRQLWRWMAGSVDSARPVAQRVAE